MITRIIRPVMPKPALPPDKKLVMQGLRIAPQAKMRLDALPTPQKRRVLAAMRQAVELVINSMTDNALHLQSGKFASENIKDNFLVDSI